MQDTVTIPFKEKMINIHFEEFEQNIDIDDLTRIDYSNLYAELITIPALMNRIGLWRAEAQSSLSAFKLDLNIYEAQRAEHYRISLIKSVASGKDTKTKYPTIAEIQDAITLDEEAQLRRRKEIRLQKELDYMEALYWAVKSKEGKLNRISENMKLTPEDFEKELVEGKWNGILIKVKQKQFIG